MLREYLQNTEDAISSGRINDAMANCRHILSFFPDALEAQRLLGEVYLAQGQLEEAQQTFDWILANDPENVIAYCDRALTSERMSDIDTALDCYQQAYELSRGNSQIRQEFNQLSAKVGQQEFMFSRAGLARLYMRGDLLTQAEQEWKAVLSTSPERLDAQTGLLETYWREGTYDKAEQLAKQILKEIPTCLKALLLLAHITSNSNLERAKELLQRAETLDPELVMAQELFSDLLASQPNDLFLELLRKEPIVLPDVSDEKQVTQIQTAMNAAVETNGSQNSAESSDRPYGWGNLESWSELDTMQVPQNAPETLQEASTLASWSEITNNNQHVESWATIDEGSSNPIGTGPEAWKISTEIDDEFDPAILEQQPWFQAELFKISTAETEKTNENLSVMASAETIQPWSTASREDDLPSPPAWLNMLTQIDRQPGGTIPTSSTQSSSVQESLESASLPQPHIEPEPAPSKLWEEDFSAVPTPPVQEDAPTSSFSSEDNDFEMEWPEWLKSLGAETIERDPEPVTAPGALESQQPLTFQAWADQLDQTLSETGQEHMATLEHLEKDLHSQGFLPLQPGTLSTLSQEPSFSPALAELDNVISQLSIPEAPTDPAHPVTSIKPVESAVPAELIPPLTTPSGPIQSGEPESWWGNTPNQGSEILTNLANEQPASSETVTPLVTPAPESDHVEAVLQQIIEPVASPAANISQVTPLIPAYRADALLENELETTMKRPAIRLQAMQSSGARSEISLMMGRGRSTERGAGSRAQDGNLSNKEHLLRGYHSQLAGAYDDAMQEYRIIIRNAPELLGEVISNVRALLKLTPKYSAGYRVLGDAYMRQGEYLQAMEAYNKALTIAKKAKSQSK